MIPIEDIRAAHKAIHGKAVPTPLVRLNHLNKAAEFPLYAKLEWMNPFGSVKDRAAWALLRELEEKGEIGNGRGMVEPTSGNTGISLAAMAKARGYHLRAVVRQIGWSPCKR